MCSASNICENVVPPSVIVTPMYGTFIKESKIEEALQRLNAFHPIGRFGKPNDITKAINILLAENSFCFAGAIWDIDGGFITGRNRHF